MINHEFYPTKNISDELHKELTTKIKQHSASVCNLSKQGKNDLAKSAEHLYKELAEIIFECKFEMPRAVNQDTYDILSKNIMVQVTCDNSNSKITSTVDLYIGKNHKTKGFNLYFFIIGQKSKYRIDKYREFDYKCIYDDDDIISTIYNKGIDQLDAAVKIMRKYFPESNQIKNLIYKDSLLETLLKIKTNISKLSNEIACVSSRINIKNANNSDENRFNESCNCLIKSISDFYIILNKNKNINFEDVNILINDIKNMINDIEILQGKYVSNFKKCSKLKNIFDSMKKLEKEIENLENQKNTVNKEIDSLKFEMLITKP